MVAPYTCYSNHFPFTTNPCLMLSQLNTVTSQASKLYLSLCCLNSSHKINMLSYVVVQNTEIYPPSGSCITMALGGYRCLQVDIFMYSAKMNRITGSITHVFLNMLKIHMCVKPMYYRCLYMHYRCMNYMCNTPKILHMYYTCGTFGRVSHCLNV